MLKIENTKTGEIVATAISREIALVVCAALRREYRETDFRVIE